MAFFLRRVRNRSEAEDLVQDVFLRVASNGGSPLTHAKGYIFQVAANILRDRARHLRVRDGTFVTKHLTDSCYLIRHGR